MAPLLPLVVTPLISSAYNAAAAALGPSRGAGAEMAGLPGNAAASGTRSFGEVLQSALEGAVQQGRAADTASMRALSGQVGATEVVLAVAKAEVALQTAVAVRDRVVAAYQDVMRMPI